MIGKDIGEKFYLRHLTPENLQTLRGQLKDQLEVLRVKPYDVINNLTWKLPKEQSSFRPVRGNA